jgi:hypothetical protein
MYTAAIASGYVAKYGTIQEDYRTEWIDNCIAAAIEIVQTMEEKWGIE